jgi:hypothetical protein
VGTKYEEMSVIAAPLLFLLSTIAEDTAPKPDLWREFRRLVSCTHASFPYAKSLSASNNAFRSTDFVGEM